VDQFGDVFVGTVASGLVAWGMGKRWNRGSTQHISSFGNRRNPFQSALVSIYTDGTEELPVSPCRKANMAAQPAAGATRLPETARAGDG